MDNLGQKRLTLFTLFFISGITGLIYEVAWTRMFVTVFGSTTHAVSTVLATVMSIAVGIIATGRGRTIRTFGLEEPPRLKGPW
jgi:hypothetical protein